ncbi:MAG: PIN domain-containing protein [Phycisphaerae bacterium]|jgi:predicted nucleic acid-binding protein
MRLYLDMCVLKRPFDDQSQERVAAETRAVLAVIERIDRGLDNLVWSSALTFENQEDPEAEPRMEVAKYAARASMRQTLSAQIEQRMRELSALGLPPLDAAHLAFAEAAGCDVLLSCDDRFIRRARRVNTMIRVLTPLEYWNEVADD